VFALIRSQSNAAIIAALLLTAGTAFADEAYLLGTQDKVKIDIYEFPNISGEFTIGASGEIGLPLVGAVPAAGRSTATLANELEDKLMKLEDVVGRPSIAIQVMEYRPFYITGNVERPGAYPYQPKLTVLKAVTMAGGMYRPSDPSLVRFARDAVNAEGSIKVLEVEAKQLRFRIERLQAELNHDQSYVGSPAPANLDDLEHSFHRQERKIFAARAQLIAGQTDALTKLRKVYEAEVTSLRERARLKRSEVQTVEDDLSRIRKLVDKGVAPASRASEFERLAADLRGEEEQLATQILRAEQGVTQTEQSLRSLLDGHEEQVVEELHKAEAAFHQTLEKIKTDKELLYEARVVAPVAYEQMIGEGGREVAYRIVREVEGETLRIAAGEDHEVKPGDVVEVVLRNKGTPVSILTE
jgi:exopolysaccharide production protein ExoF